MAKVNNIVRSPNRRSLLPSGKVALGSASTFDQGDLLWLDPSAKVLKPLSAAADSVGMQGVAVVSMSAGKLISPYQGTAVDAALAISDAEVAVLGVVAKLTLKTGDAFDPGLKVYHDASSGNAKTVTVTAAMGSVAIGIYVGPVVASASAGQQGEILIGAQVDGKLEV